MSDSDHVETSLGLISQCCVIFQSLMSLAKVEKVLSSALIAAALRKVRSPPPAMSGQESLIPNLPHLTIVGQGVCRIFQQDDAFPIEALHSLSRHYRRSDKDTSIQHPNPSGSTDTKESWRTWICQLICAPYKYMDRSYALTAKSRRWWRWWALCPL